MKCERLTNIRNRILLAMSPDDLNLLRPFFEKVALNVGDVLVEPKRPIRHVHFLEQGVCSVVVRGADGTCIEVSQIGREGMSGTSVILGQDQSPNLTSVKIAGQAHRMWAEDLRISMDASASLRNVLLRYIHTVMGQQATTAYANGHDSVTRRLARWLLMCHDRIETDEVPLTHNGLSEILGVRRAGVTMALSILEGEHMIRCSRGRVTLLSRAKLQAMAGDSYGVPEAEYDRVFGSEDRRACA